MTTISNWKPLRPLENMSVVTKSSAVSRFVVIWAGEFCLDELNSIIL